VDMITFRIVRVGAAKQDAQKGRQWQHYIFHCR
jgi:hypothetical protein